MSTSTHASPTLDPLTLAWEDQSAGSPAAADPIRVGRPGLTSPRSWAELVYALIDLPLSIVFLVLPITLIAVGAGLSVIYVGVPLLMLGVLVARFGGAVQRALARVFLGLPVPGPGPIRRRRPGAVGSMTAVVADAAGWRALAYASIKIVLAPVTFTAAIGFWVAGLGALSYPIWRPFLPAEQAADGSWHRGTQWGPGFFVDSLWTMAAQAAAGLLLLWLAPRVLRFLTTLDRMRIVSMLGPR